MDWDYFGLVKFDGTTWTVYHFSNSGLTDYRVTAIALDGSGNKWIGTKSGLAKSTALYGRCITLLILVCRLTMFHQ